MRYRLLLQSFVFPFFLPFLLVVAFLLTLMTSFFCYHKIDTIFERMDYTLKVNGANIDKAFDLNEMMTLRKWLNQLKPDQDSALILDIHWKKVHSEEFFNHLQTPTASYVSPFSVSFSRPIVFNGFMWGELVLTVNVIDFSLQTISERSSLYQVVMLALLLFGGMIYIYFLRDKFRFQIHLRDIVYYFENKDYATLTQMLQSIEYRNDPLLKNLLPGLMTLCKKQIQEKEIAGIQQIVHDMKSGLGILKKLNLHPIVDDLEQQVQNILSVNAPEKNYLHAQREEIVFRPMFLEWWRNNNRECSFFLGRDVDRSVISGHQEELKAILLNLVGNSLEALKIKSKEKQIIKCIARVADKQQKLELIIVDNGPGIVIKENNSAVTGSRGRGLHFVNEKMSEWGGQMVITSKKGRGTTIKLSFPVKLLTKIKPSNNGQFQTIHIDDNELYRHMWQNEAKKEGHSLLSVDSPETLMKTLSGVAPTAETPFFIDHCLSTSVCNGLTWAIYLDSMGYSSINLIGNYPRLKEVIPPHSHIRRIEGSFPLKKNKA